MTIDGSKSNRSGSNLQKIVVLGGGTAGLLAALAIRKHLPHMEVVVVRSTRLGVVGVGEGTIPSVVNFLHGFLEIDQFRFIAESKASPKLGIRYLWGPRDFFHYSFSGQLIHRHPGLSMPRGYYCQEDFQYADLDSALMAHDRVCLRLPNGRPKNNLNIAYHLENKNFVALLERICDEADLTRIDAIVSSVETGDQGVTALNLDNGARVDGDLFVDCSGFSAELIDKTMGEEWVDFGKALFCDRAVVAGWTRSDEIYHPYTTAETMQAGWCWQIEHDEIINRGYVFCSQFLSDDEAVSEFRKKNPAAGDPRVIRFDAGVRRRSWVKNVVALGNAAGFVEPLEATAIGMICDATVRLVRSLESSGGRIIDRQVEIFNRITLDNWTIIRDFLALHYKFNTRLDTPFWQAARADVELGRVQELVEYYQQVGPDFSILNWEMKRDFFTAEGYLVMLLGQQVPFERHVQLTGQDQASWNKLRSNLATLAANGLTVPEYLELARSPGAREIFSGQHAKLKSEQKATRVGESERTGELHWH